MLGLYRMEAICPLNTKWAKTLFLLFPASTNALEHPRREATTGSARLFPVSAQSQCFLSTRVREQLRSSAAPV